jgi:hypothetical protein
MTSSMSSPMMRRVLPAGQREELLGQRGAAFGGLADMAQVRLAMRLVRKPEHGQVGVPEDAGEDVAEVVGDAARKAAHALHEVGLDELLLEELALADLPPFPERTAEDVGDAAPGGFGPDHVVEGPGLDGLDRRLFLAGSCDHDHRVRRLVAARRQQLGAAAVGKHKIHDEQVGECLRQMRTGLGQRVSHVEDREARQGLGGATDESHEGLLRLDHEDPQRVLR